ncbi:DUF3263 domain-containing protein [Curtobacterium sp. MCSS17_006]|uniref:DUF3263 domain-containing protein n=1 Tax=Curtobacterium sp. MCSS17_006 TaxID=2175642 RepID=UPI000DA7E7E1|nr:DUF3263 domain-containing protein [Curtobacterium sp. MCSS17_006]PZE34029.1 DUF3263 domain-containing protein [Curtobacterium sp. MCSS17_006]
MTGDERAVLTFEEQHPRNDRRKEAAIRTELAVSWVRYRQVLLRLTAREDVVAEFPVVAHRVQRATERALAARATRTFA